MLSELNHWKKNWHLMEGFFTSNEIDAIRDKLEKIRVDHVVYCSFENRFAKCGGLAAVTTRILPYFDKLENIKKVILITPFYPLISDIQKLEKTGITFDVSFNNSPTRVELLKYCDNESRKTGGRTIEEFYIYAPGFFNANNRFKDPYIYFERLPGESQIDFLKKNESAQRYNALFFAKAVPAAAKAVGLTENIVFHLQEWQTTLVSLTAKIAMIEGNLKSCASVQTMHNTFDSYVPPEELRLILDENYFNRYLYFARNQFHTALQLGLQLVDGPISVVSDHYAVEITSDIIQTGYFASHLQGIFRYNGVYGINNGMFEPFPPDYEPGKTHSLIEVKQIKEEKRKNLLSVLDNCSPDGKFGELTFEGKSIKSLPPDIPIYMMNGRLDPVQKGFDILLRAVEKFKEDEIKVILTPMPVEQSDLDFFRDIAGRCRGNLVVFPTRISKEQFDVMKMGSTYGVMPSIYEPFGAAIEYMVNGTVTIGRETGGLKNQVTHGVDGFLYRESVESYKLDNIKDFMENFTCVEKRGSNLWVKGMVEQLYNIMKHGTWLFRENPGVYYTMVLKGFEKALKFRWELSAQKYMEMFENVCVFS